MKVIFELIFELLYGQVIDHNCIRRITNQIYEKFKNTHSAKLHGIAATITVIHNFKHNQ